MLKERNTACDSNPNNYQVFFDTFLSYLQLWTDYPTKDYPLSVLLYSIWFFCQ